MTKNTEKCLSENEEQVFMRNEKFITNARVQHILPAAEITLKLQKEKPDLQKTFREKNLKTLRLTAFAEKYFNDTEKTILLKS